VTYVNVSDVAVSPLPADGPAGWSLYVGTASSGLTGLSATAAAHLRYTFASPMAAGSGVLTGLAASSAVTSDYPTDVYAEFDYLQAPAASWEILFADLPGPSALTNPAATFQSNYAVGAIPANTSATLAQFDAALASLPAASVMGIEFFDLSLSTYRSAKINGTQYIFTPTPVSTAPTTIALADFAVTPGITVTTNGFLPGDSVDVVYDTPGGSATIATLTADGQGSITFSHFDPAAAVGAYKLRFFSSVPNGQVFAFDVTAAVLAETGATATLPLLAASGLLMTGLVLAAVAVRRRSRTI